MPIFYLAGIAMYFIEMYNFYQWWGTSGLLSGIFLGPILSWFFPFIYWYKVEFPVFYTILWLVGIVALIVSSSER